MWICKDCKNVFDECYRDYETHGLDTPPYEKILRCPHCLICNPAFAYKCENCNDYTDRVIDGYCEDCAKELMQSFKEQITRMFPNSKDRHFLLYNALCEQDWGLV